MNKKMIEYLIAEVKKDIKNREKRIAYKAANGEFVECRIQVLEEKKQYLKVLEEMLEQA